MLFHENCLLADDSHEISYLIYWKIKKYVAEIAICCICDLRFKAAYSVTMNIFRKILFYFKSFVKAELSYFFTLKMLSTAENCMVK